MFDPRSLLASVVALARVELCAAELLSLLMDRVEKVLCMRISKKHYFSDSTTVLRWLGKESRIFQTFVANRVARIQRLSSVDSWHYVPNDDNLADFPSRGLTSEELLMSEKLHLWLYGPEFLTRPPADWPEFPWKRSNDDDSNLPEMKRKVKVASGFSALNVKELHDEVSSLDPKFHCREGISEIYTNFQQ